MNKKTVTPMRCACGRRAFIAASQEQGNAHVRCARGRCWDGPICASKRRAVARWNRLMALAQARKDG